MFTANRGWQYIEYQRLQTTIDCKTVRIFAYSSTREQSNEAFSRLTRP